MSTRARHIRPISITTASLIMLTSLALSSCSAESDPSLESRVPVLSTMRNTHSIPTSTSGMSPADGPQTADIDETLNGGAPAWNLPTEFEDWTTAPAEETSKQQLQKANGCTFTASERALDFTNTTGDYDATKNQVNEWQEKLGADAVDPVFTEEDSIDIQGSQNDKVDTIRVNTTYTASDGTGYRSATWVRAFMEAKTPTAVVLNYDCPSDKYNESELGRLLDNTRLQNVEHAAMR